MAITEKGILNRLYFVAACMFLFAVGVSVKLLDIQFVDGEYYKQLAEERTYRNFKIPSNRGNLYDSNGSLLATSIPKYDIRQFSFLLCAETSYGQSQQAALPFNNKRSWLFRIS